METTKAMVRKWGNSLGIVLPKEIINKQNIKEGSELEILINLKTKTKAGDIFGILKGKLTRDTDDLLKEVDKDFENE